ncbi:pfkB-like carbohydrate kinase family protein [Actinidia rufa]|uniref:PfkB-like carbohydrate kinase family protein n=1 Tax=Actinidia rufa TaxID=165716 RepID=A0A7J0DZU8_9ERIC|nr:pfkB-like carbohydrate kinase family protein [Actinidia rufa]
MSFSLLYHVSRSSISNIVACPAPSPVISNPVLSLLSNPPPSSKNHHSRPHHVSTARITAITSSSSSPTSPCALFSPNNSTPFLPSMSISDAALPPLSKLSCSSFSPSSSSSPSFSFSGRSDDHVAEKFESDGEEDADAHIHAHIVETTEDTISSASPDRWDVLGLGQAMVDFSGMVDDEFLDRLGLEKGTRKLVNHEERGRVLRAMDGCSYKAAAGGSLSNSLVALARLGAHPIGGPPLNVAMAGSVGSDPLGGFYRSKLCRANVNFLSPPVKNGTTGTVIVLTTSDAQRTMLAYQGTSSAVNYDPCLASLISKTNILVVEGYLFELPDTIKTITKACEDAHRSGALVAITASDVSCIERHYDDFWEIMGNYADIVFANSDEARAFCHFSSKESHISAARYLSHFVPFVSVTDGPRGSYIGVKGEVVYIPPSPCVPVDTCGAGDAYASGILYGILRGVSDFKVMGTLAARVASVVVGQQGTRLRVQAAVELAESFAFYFKSSTFRSDVGSDQISSL